MHKKLYVIFSNSFVEYRQSTNWIGSSRIVSILQSTWYYTKPIRYPDIVSYNILGAKALLSYFWRSLSSQCLSVDTTGSYWLASISLWSTLGDCLYIGLIRHLSWGFWLTYCWQPDLNSIIYMHFSTLETTAQWSSKF